MGRDHLLSQALHAALPAVLDAPFPPVGDASLDPTAVLLRLLSGKSAQMTSHRTSIARIHTLPLPYKLQ